MVLTLILLKKRALQGLVEGRYRVGIRQVSGWYKAGLGLVCSTW